MNAATRVTGNNSTVAIALCPGRRSATGFAEARSPLGFRGGLSNLSDYVGDDPTNATDPSGLAEVGANKYGHFFLTQEAISAPGPRGGYYSCPTTIVFTPNADNVKADVIAFVQVVATLDSNTLDRAGGELPEGVDRIYNKKWQVDRIVGKSSPWIGYNNDGSPDPRRLKPGSTTGKTVVNAEMNDTPSWYKVNTTWEFMTAVICKSGPDKGQIYGVVTWGFKADENKIVTLTKPNLSDEPNANWLGAATQWNAQALGYTEKKNSPGQETFDVKRWNITSKPPAPPASPPVVPQKTITVEEATSAAATRLKGRTTINVPNDLTSGLLLSSTESKTLQGGVREVWKLQDGRIIIYNKSK